MDEKPGRMLSNARIFGETAWLWSQSPLHGDWPVRSMHQWILPAIMHQQFRLYHRDGVPRAYVSWAWLSQEAESRYVMNAAALQPKDWVSGKRCWIVDFIAPFGDATVVVRDLRHSLFADQVGRALRLHRQKPEARIIYLHGARAVAQARDPDLSPTVDLKAAAQRGSPH